MVIRACALVLTRNPGESNSSVLPSELFSVFAIPLFRSRPLFDGHARMGAAWHEASRLLWSWILLFRSWRLCTWQLSSAACSLLPWPVCHRRPK